ncbi:hypothetical protein HGA91_06705 [candidate division WWE3 bacterium]|nr:hypothetical protein [candidate division WWE3 bacterium]
MEIIVAFLVIAVVVAAFASRGNTPGGYGLNQVTGLVEEIPGNESGCSQLFGVVLLFGTVIGVLIFSMR